MSRTSLLAVCWIAAVACGDGDGGSGDAAGAPVREGSEANEVREDGGGNTGDFTGHNGGADVALCEDEKQEAPGDDPTLGFSVNQFIAATASTFHIPVRWQSACDDPERDDHPRCAAGARDPLEAALAGTETTVHFTIAHTGEPARVHYRATSSSCGESMWLPVEIMVVSDDGAFDEVERIEAVTECGFAFGLGLRESLSTWQGRIGEAAMGWSANAYAEVSLGFYGDRVTFDAYLNPDGRFGPGWLLHAALPSSAELTDAADPSLSRSEVGSSDDVVIRTEGCGGPAGA